MGQSISTGTITDTASSNTAVPPTASQPGYAVYFREIGISFFHTAPYLISGAPEGFESWIIHISVVCQQFDSVIRPIFKFLQTEEFPFAIPADAGQHNNILGGLIGFQLTGKVISIGVSDSANFTEIINKLLELTKGVIGPSIPCAYHLTGTIAVNYGSLFGDNNCSHIARSMFYGSAAANSLMEILKANGQHWPFYDIRPLKAYKTPRLVNRNYIPVETLKRDPKGDVIKALRINRIFDMQWCVIKQGRRYQSFDDAGRDARDRLHWQYDVHRLLESQNILPKAIACFESMGDAFFAMEYIESVPLSEKAAQLSQGLVWRSMPAERKREMIGYLLQVVHVLAAFHADGFVHRDVTPANFIVTESGQVFAIDIELCYNLATRTPNPPFTLGTPGYMSPAQESGAEPIFGDDIYSLGALFISVLTSILPNKFNHNNPDQLTGNLAYFIESTSMVSMIVSCLDVNASRRPSLDQIEKVLKLNDTLLLTTKQTVRPPKQHPFYLNTMLDDCLLTLTKLFFEKNRNAEMLNLTPEHFRNETTFSETNAMELPGLREIYVLASCARFGSETTRSKVIAQVVSWLDKIDKTRHSETDLRILEAGLTQLLSRNDLRPYLMDNINSLPGYFHHELSPGISGGLAGHGLQLLFLLDEEAYLPAINQLAEIVGQLSVLQQKNGAWITGPAVPGLREYQVTGFSHGVAGITYFLLCYYAVYPSEGLRTRITAALQWLTSQRKPDRGRLTWPVSNENKTVDPWLEHGFSGVALTYIKAFEILGDPGYREIAAGVLAYHPVQITSNYCAFGNGLSGLGEVYLEALRVFGDEEWQIRANAVRDALLNSCYRDQGTCYWLDGTQPEPLTDFLTGNSGTLHFLLRFAHPGQIPFPSFLIP